MVVPTLAYTGTRPTRERQAPGWRAPLAIFAVLFLLYVATSTRGIASTDDHAPAVEAWRIASAGTPWLEGALHETHVAADPWLHQVANGHVVADRMAGPVLISVPFYLLLDRNPRVFTLVPGGVAAAFVTALTGTLMFLALRRRLGDLLGATGALALALGTPTWSVSADGPWTHTVTQLGLAGAAYASSRRSWWLAGTFLAVGMLGRPHLAVVALVLGLGMALTLRRPRPAFAVGLPCVAALLLLLAWNHMMFGVWSVASVGYTGHGAAALGGRAVSADLVGWTHRFANYAGFLVAPDRGLLVWTPVVFAMVPAVWRARRTLPSWSLWLALGGVLYSVIQLQMTPFHGGDNFYGYRTALELVTCLTPALAFSTSRLRRAGRVTVPALLGVQVGAIAVGAATPALFVPVSQVWRTNAFAMAVGALPVLLTFWLVFCVVCGLWVPVAARRATAERTTR